MEDVYFEKGAILFNTTTPLDKAFFILKGSVTLSMTMGEKTLSLDVGANHFVGDAAVAITHKIAGSETLGYFAQAVANEPVTATLIPIKQIQQELEQAPPLLRAWVASFTGRILKLIEQLTASESIN
ncbi:MAG TPA: cyclic nucleotide-binding domain-containing protein [Cellvibrio sp.]|nr:cyclic nucleotide-binding domain-containing protein [Cellvibrio sp.]